VRTSESIDQLATALAEFQKNMPIVPKLHTGHVEGKSKASGKEYSYDYSYADLGDAVEAARPLLGENGLAVSQMPEWEDSRDVLTTRVMHKSGQWEEGTMRLLVPELAVTPQVQGSAISYAKRYAYCAALGIVADVDLDGILAELAYGANATRKRKPPSSSTPTTGRRPVQGRDPATSDGEPAMSARDRNKLITYFAHLTPPITDPKAITAEVNKHLVAPVEALVKLSAAQGASLFAILGIDSPAVPPRVGGEQTEETV
jgi:hypothetical protein